MELYQYSAKDINGKTVHGQVQAATEQQAYQEIKNTGVYVTRLKRIMEKSRTKRLRSWHLTDCCKQTSVMLKSGISLVQAMRILGQQEKEPKMAQIYRSVYHSLLQGYVLSQVLECQGDLFPPLAISMVRAGEAGGRLEGAIEELAVYYEKDSRLKRKIGSALIYPCFLAGVMAVSAVILFTAVLPNFFSMFEGLTDLPASTRFLMWLSQGIVNHGYVILSILAAGIVLMIYLSQKKTVRLLVGECLLTLPVLGDLLSSIYTARFASTLSTLYAQGISLVQGLRLTIDVMGNQFLENQLKIVMQDFCEGVPLSVGVAGVKGLHGRLAASIFIGEETGELHSLLKDVANGLDTEAEEAIKRITTLIEPVMIVLMAVVIGFVLFSVMIPFLQYYETIGL